MPRSRSEQTKQRAKLFWSGRSQAVRLPKDFRFEGDAVLIRRDGQKVILEPDNGWSPEFLAWMDSAPLLTDEPFVDLRDRRQQKRPLLDALFSDDDEVWAAAVAREKRRQKRLGSGKRR